MGVGIRMLHAVVDWGLGLHVVGPRVCDRAVPTRAGWDDRVRWRAWMVATVMMRGGMKRGAQREVVMGVFLRGR